MSKEQDLKAFTEWETTGSCGMSDVWLAAIEYERERVKRETEKLEAEIAELKNKNRKMRVLQWITEGVYDDDAHIAAIAEAVKAGDWTKFLHDTYTAGIAHGRNVCNSEHEARTQRLLEALEFYAKTGPIYYMSGVSVEIVERGDIARQALAEYRGEIPESGEEE